MCSAMWWMQVVRLATLALSYYENRKCYIVNEGSNVYALFKRLDFGKIKTHPCSRLLCCGSQQVQGGRSNLLIWFLCWICAILTSQRAQAPQSTFENHQVLVMAKATLNYRETCLERLCRCCPSVSEVSVPQLWRCFCLFASFDFAELCYFGSMKKDAMLIYRLVYYPIIHKLCSQHL